MSTSVVIAGTGVAPTRADEHRDTMDVMAQACIEATRDAGIQLRDIDAIFTATAQVALPTLALAEYLGITPRYLDSTVHGGASNLSHLQHAVAAINAGQIEVALIAYGSTQRTALKATGTRPMVAAAPPLEAMANPRYPITSYALMASRYLHQWEVPREYLSAVAIAASRWGALNPAAQRRELLSHEEILASPAVAEPFHTLDCCLITDGAGALVVMSQQKAKSLGLAQTVTIAAVADVTEHDGMMAMPDLTSTGARLTGASAFEQAGFGPNEVNTVQIYDAFTINPILILEDLGFCDRGQAGRFIADGHTSPGGKLPMNTSGGGLAYTHPGMFGIYTILESVAQLRGRAGQRQVPAKTALAHGIGGTMSSHSTVLLTV
ncbi:thiolase [Arthrobacter sp. MYb229]|uniref:acetyl-CoA acetyltransferase n=1 Tax=unclassified Arthrobacter TaxID=235627 RepID=UPI000CFBF284|nr:MULTISPECIES: acetyl-CoA acetyltransferase [unclassified Arthrobacter]PRA06917.1 thiolase [Arthrobacter sp. MYb229]PRB47865.1 thiolase [Arthrobacter sp. MYb216]